MLELVVVAATAICCLSLHIALLERLLHISLC